jgi:WD40 repeat protein
VMAVLLASTGESAIRARVDTALREALAERGADTAMLPALRAAVEPEIARARTPWSRFFLSHDPSTVLRRVRQPVLALFGGLDLQVPPAENRPLMEQALREAGVPHVVRELPSLNHLFQTAQTGAPTEYGRLEETFAPAALEAISEWVLRQVAQSRDGARGEGAAWRARELRDGHAGQVEGVAFSPDGLWLASADNSGVVIVRRVDGTGVPRRLIGRNFTEVAWSADGRTVVAGGFDSLVYVWRWQDTTRARTLPYRGQVEAVAVSPSGVILAAGGGERTIRRWVLGSGAELPPLRGHADDVHTVKASADGRRIASGGRDRTIRIWEAATGRLVRVLRNHRDSVYDLVFGPSGSWIVSGCRDGTVGVWDVKSGTITRLLRGPMNSIHGVAVSPNGSVIAGAGFENNVWLWPHPSGPRLPTLAGHRRKVSGVAFHPGGGWLASAASDTTIRLWEVPRQ